MLWVQGTDSSLLLPMPSKTLDMGQPRYPELCTGSDQGVQGPSWCYNLQIQRFMVIPAHTDPRCQKSSQAKQNGSPEWDCRTPWPQHPSRAARTLPCCRDPPAPLQSRCSHCPHSLSTKLGEEFGKQGWGSPCAGETLRCCY